MTYIQIAPAINAFLNGTAAVLLVVGHRFITSGKVEKHKRTMIAAFVTSSLFLVNYLTYHTLIHGSKHFPGQGWVRYLYFTILLTHTMLAVVIVPMVLMTLSRGLKRNYPRHRAIARWTYPLWLYVSVTGVVIYLMLYQLF
jgi:putative membrane protein